jgi:predicted transcriptional regulator
MLKAYKKSESGLIVRKIRREMAALRAELYEYRYHFERNVEKRTEHLLKRIEELEACNAQLCDQLALMRQAS